MADSYESNFEFYEIRLHVFMLTVLQLFNVVYASINCLYFIKGAHLCVLCFLSLFYIFLNGFS